MFLTGTQLDIEFSPPYGDGTGLIFVQPRMIPFSPPYGDGTECCTPAEKQATFSPPYGDGTLNISQNIVKWKN